MSRLLPFFVANKKRLGIHNMYSLGFFFDWWKKFIILFFYTQVFFSLYNMKYVVGKIVASTSAEKIYVYLNTIHLGVSSK
jgi:hypothetical protein